MTGEVADSMEALSKRARVLIQEFGEAAADDAASGLSPAEIAGSVTRALALPEVSSIRAKLVPELPIYASTATKNLEEVTVGIADAVALSAEGKPEVIIDWKSDVEPSPETLEHYRSQVRAYLEATGAERGLIVLVTSGLVIPVAASAAARLRS